MKIKANELKLMNLLNKYSKRFNSKYILKKNNGDFSLNIETEELGELIRRLGHIKNCKFDIKEMKNVGTKEWEEIGEKKWE